MSENEINLFESRADIKAGNEASGLIGSGIQFLKKLFNNLSTGKCLTSCSLSHAMFQMIILLGFLSLFQPESHLYCI